jgi:hypothetical protein
MKKLLDADDPFFAVPWRRWATSIFPVAWGLVEFWFAEPFWGVLFIGAGVYAGYELLIKGPSGTK